MLCAELFQEKDRIIETQKRELETLRRLQQSAGAWQGRPGQRSARLDPAAGEHWHNAQPPEQPVVQPGGAPPSKPPVPSRERVNRKLHIGGQPPPPPPRGVSLQTFGPPPPRAAGGGASVARSKYGGGVPSDADDSGLGWQLVRPGLEREVTGAGHGHHSIASSGHHRLVDSVVPSDAVSRDADKTATFSSVTDCDSQLQVTPVLDKETDDSGRESDETFDSESVKSESAAGDDQRHPGELGMVGETPTRTRPSDKTRVTFWTDTYL